MKSFDEIEKLWLEWYDLPFPSGLAGEEMKGICLTSLDTFTAGCIDTFVDKKGSLDSKRVLILRQGKRDLEIVVQNLEGDAKSYFEGLLSLADKVLLVVEKRAS